MIRVKGFTRVEQTIGGIEWNKDNINIECNMLK